MRLESNVGCSMPAPTITRTPPRRSWQKPASTAAFFPEHSSTTWTARLEILSGSRGEKTSSSEGSITSVAPTSRARRRRPSDGSTTVTWSTPMARSAPTVSAPMGPAPITMAVSPGPMPDRVMPCRATANGSASAAWRAESPSGRRRTPAARTRTNSAKAPSP